LGIQTAYADVVEKDSLVPDQSQQNIVDAMQRLQEQLEARPGWLQSVRAVFNTRQHAVPQKGLYLWGGVGRGKTFLMDLFFHSLDVPRKKRIHFHRMMREVHERLSAVGNIENPLDHIAGEIASETRVLCFDEFFVSDIGDAMLLGKLLDGLFSRGVTLVTTSNSPPERLYPDGLQRERFLPAIALLEQHTDVVEMDGGIDYRLKLLKQAGTYLTPADEAAQHKLQQYFAGIARDEAIEGHSLDIFGRDIRTLRCATGVAWFDFLEICDGPRSQNDYIEIARWYQTIIISDVPIFDSDSENQARRFISLVDEFYDRRVNLILSVAAGIDSLYRGSKLAFEFERTASRLVEMQSADYIHKAHIA